MNTVKLSNVPLSDFRRFLFDYGCTRSESGTKGRGGHEKWTRNDLDRPITLQTHVDPVPEHVIRNCLRDLGIQRKDFEQWLLKKH